MPSRRGNLNSADWKRAGTKAIALNQTTASRGGIFAHPLAAPLLWGAIAAAFGGFVARLDPNMLEEGIILHTAERMLGGEHLYRDVIVHTAPLPYELLAAGFRLFGAEFWVARVLLVLFQTLGVAALFAAVRRSGTRELAHVAAAIVATAPIFLFPQLSNYYYTTIAFYLTLVAAYLGSRGVSSQGWAVAAGAMLSLIALCKQTTGVVFAIPFATALLVLTPPSERWRRALAVVAGGAAIAVVTLAIYALRGDLRSLWFGIVELPLSMGNTYRAPYLNVWPPGELAPDVRENWVMYVPSLYYLKYGLFATLGQPIIWTTQLLYVLPFGAVAATVLRAWRGGLTSAGWLHGAVLLAMTLNVFPRSSWGHLVVALPPSLVQLALLLRRADAPAPRWGRALGVSFTVACTAVAAATAAWIESQAGPATFGPRVPVRPVSRAYKQPSIPRVIQYIDNRTRPGDPIFVTRQEPLIYFATQTRNPTPFGGVLPGLRDFQEPLILAALEDTRYVVMSDIDQPLYTYYAAELPGVQRYLERHYSVPADFVLDDYSWIVVVARGRDRGETLIDLVDERDRGSAWVRDRDGRTRPAEGTPQHLAARQLNRPLPIALGSRGGGIDFEVDLPPNAVFQAGVGYRGLVSIDHQYIHPGGITLSLAMDAGAGFETLHSLQIDDSLRAGRRWVPFEVDLGAYANQHVTIRLEASSAPSTEPGRLTWWGSPRIALQPLD